MKISTLHFCTSDSWGGLELYACTLMSELKNAGVNVFAICKKNSKIEKYLIEQNFVMKNYNTVMTILWQEQYKNVKL